MGEKRFALIVGTSEYQDPDLKALKSPAQDAEALTEVLGDPNIGRFEVRMLLNKPSHVINEEIEAFFIDRERNDLLLLYFSCHGIKDVLGNLYFATCNTVSKIILSTSVSANLVNYIFEQSPANQRLIILDCCYSGTYIRMRSMINHDRNISNERNFLQFNTVFFPTR